MKKVIDFIKSNILVVKWTAWYFLGLWLILRLVFNFDMFSAHYWWKFFHATLHGFGGLVFGLIIYTAIPIYIATTLTVYRKKELIITIPFIDKILPKKKDEAKSEETPTPTESETKGPEFPIDMPVELRVPYMRAKNNMSLTGPISIYNKTENTKQEIPNATEDTPIPIPTDFDISESFDTEIQNNESVPMFRDITFDEPVEQKTEELTNNTTKYFSEKNIEFETYHEFVATEKYVIYEHNDEDFWIFDENTWFAPGKQKDSPVEELIGLAKQNDLKPVLYLKSQNIMDIESTINRFENLGIRVIKNLEELD